MDQKPEIVHAHPVLDIRIATGGDDEGLFLVIEINGTPYCFTPESTEFLLQGIDKTLTVLQREVEMHNLLKP